MKKPRSMQEPPGRAGAAVEELEACTRWVELWPGAWEGGLTKYTKGSMSSPTGRKSSFSPLTLYSAMDTSKFTAECGSQLA